MENITIKPIDYINYIVNECISKVYLHFGICYTHFCKAKMNIHTQNVSGRNIYSFAINNTLEHPVQLNLIFKEITEDDFDFNIFCDYCEHKNEKEGFEIIKCIKLSTLLSDKNLKKLIGYSKLNGNDDIRGGGCGNYNIPVSDFKYTIINENGITIHDLLEIIYRLKGSKYDFWYELFSSINIKKQTDNYIKFKIDFDYGS
ncbi:hypothetical protein [Moumouvirus maliensis]|nr:hypothetical protein [Moumouvirus maliensis]